MYSPREPSGSFLFYRIMPGAILDKYGMESSAHQAPADVSTERWQPSGSWWSCRVYRI